MDRGTSQTGSESFNKFFVMQYCSHNCRKTRCLSTFARINEHAHCLLTFSKQWETASKQSTSSFNYIFTSKSKVVGNNECSCATGN